MTTFTGVITLTVFTCHDDFVSILTAVYDAWSSRLGHSNVKLMTEPILQQELFCDYIHVDPDRDKCDKIVSAVRTKISTTAYIWIYYAVCSTDDNKADLIYRFLVHGFHFGPQITEMLQDPTVIRLMEIRRRVGNEAHLSREFLRFTSIDGRLYVAHFSPHADVLMSVADHFADRMPSEHWIIIDDTRGIAAVHPINQPYFLQDLTDDELTKLKQTEASRDYFTSLWKTYFTSIAIKERENYICQRTHFPLWMRGHATEFND